MSGLEIRPIGDGDRAAVDALAVRFWGETRVVALNGVIETSGLPGAVAVLNGAVAGAATWRREGDALRIVTIASVREGIGIGRELLGAAEREARATGAARIVLATTNDNLRALGFYQRNGFVLLAVHPGAVDRMRAIKPTIPEVADNGIPIRDQLDLEKPLAPAAKRACEEDAEAYGPLASEWSSDADSEAYDRL
jgi:GNAT superfamily N-acetyltransferase